MEITQGKPTFEKLYSEGKELILKSETDELDLVEFNEWLTKGISAMEEYTPNSLNFERFLTISKSTTLPTDIKNLKQLVGIIKGS